MRLGKIAILGATGPTGIHLARALQNRDSRLRMVSRSLSNLERTFPGEAIDRVPADALDEAQLIRAIEGCDLVFDCIGLPGDRIHEHPVTARNIARALSKTGAGCVQISSYWAYLPLARLPLTEEHPRRDGPPWVRYRREAEDILQQAGAAILHLPDFYGPHVHTSTVQNALSDAVRGKPMSWIGPADVEREYIYVPDAMALAAEVAIHESAYGERFVLPGAGPLTGRALAEIAGDHLGRAVKLRTAGPLLLRIVSLFDQDLRGFMQMVPHYTEPISYDASKLRRLVGEVRMEAYSEGVRATLDWLQARPGGS